MKLIDDWRQSWKWFSQQSKLAAASLLLAWSELGALQSSIPAKYVMLIAGSILVLGFLGRYIDQSKPKENV